MIFVEFSPPRSLIGNPIYHESTGELIIWPYFQLGVLISKGEMLIFLLFPSFLPFFILNHYVHSHFPPSTTAFKLFLICDSLVRESRVTFTVAWWVERKTNRQTALDRPLPQDNILFQELLSCLACSFSLFASSTVTTHAFTFTHVKDTQYSVYYFI